MIWSLLLLKLWFDVLEVMEHVRVVQYVVDLRLQRKTIKYDLVRSKIFCCP